MDMQTSRELLAELQVLTRVHHLHLGSRSSSLLTLGIVNVLQIQIQRQFQNLQP
ncbi:hypothetical protein SOVF_112350 isoform B [Spinacia oleracea]|nr:hypothetical protein SOVF_112350 isoform B [Spinacia oleracea]